MTASAQSQALAARLAAAVREQAIAAGSDTPAVRGATWRLATVASIVADGNVTTSDGITARRLESYQSPGAGDLIAITQSPGGAWIAWGRLSTGTIAVGETRTVRKPSSTSRDSTTALAADPHLTVDVVPGEYVLDAFIAYDADSAADLKLGWFAPASTAGAWWPGGSDSSNTTLAATTRWGSPPDLTTTALPVAGVGAGTITACRPVATAVVTATGQISLAWAQNASSATPTIVRGQSWLQVRRIA
ncbi:hypothetical protein [Streptomyces sp. NPDC005953]|uniref:hypothetical protein n=1 Tax=Streptomyces sp. NPDC005953 TaxID=3156719 RepID=UPI0033EDD79F